MIGSMARYRGTDLLEVPTIYKAYDAYVRAVM